MRPNQYGYLKQEDINAFWKQFPSAAAWLSDQDQRRELEALRAELAGQVTPDRLRMIEKRIGELEWRYGTEETGGDATTTPDA